MEKRVTDYLEYSPILLGVQYQDKKEIFDAVHQLVLEKKLGHRRFCR